MLSILLPLQGGHLQEGGVTWRKEAWPGTGGGGCWQPPAELVTFDSSQRLVFPISEIPAEKQFLWAASEVAGGPCRPGCVHAHM